MLPIIILTLTMGIFAGVIMTYIWLSKTASKRFAYLEAETRAKAKVIESESALLLQEAKVAIKKEELELQKTLKIKMSSIEEQEKSLFAERQKLEQIEEKLYKFSRNLNQKERKLEQLEQEKENIIDVNLKKWSRSLL